MKDGVLKMTDTFSSEKRSSIMRSVKSKNTSLETKLALALWRKGIRYRKNVQDLFGKPDLAFKKRKIVIFIDSCFWHGCPEHCRLPAANQDYWKKKIDRNIKRDIEVTEHYNKLKWTVVRVWEHEMKQDLDRIVDVLVERIKGR